MENSTVCMTEKASGTHSLPIVLPQIHVAVRGAFLLKYFEKNPLSLHDLYLNFLGFHDQTAKIH